MTCGVYSINFGEHLYIGSSSNIEQRWHAHNSHFRNGKHANRFMQRLFDKGHKPIFKQIEECPVYQILELEQYWFDILNPNLNMAKYPAAPMRGRKHTPWSKIHRKRTEKECLAMSVARKGISKGPHSSETRRRMMLSSPKRRSILCVETGQIFNSGYDAVLWLQEKGLVKNARNSCVNVNSARRGALKTCRGYTWKDA